VRRVYASASANIAATSAKDSTVGLDFDRYPLAVVPFVVRLERVPYLRWFAKKAYMFLENRDLADGVLNSRGWVAQDKFPPHIAVDGPSLKVQIQLVNLFPKHILRMGISLKSVQRPVGQRRLDSCTPHATASVCGTITNSMSVSHQERCLSTRIMNFTSSEVGWECQTHVANEVFTGGLPLSPSLRQSKGISLFLKLQRFLLGDAQQTALSGWNSELHQAWVEFVVYYSGCAFTCATDRLIAINGIAQDIARLTSDTFICGLWKSNITKQLLWERAEFEPKIQSPWHAPSWTWASMSIRVQYHCFLSYPQLTDTRDYVTLDTLDLSTRASGQIERASLTLRGKIVRATLTIKDSRALAENEADVQYGTGNTAHYVFASMDDNVATFYTKPVIFMAIMGCHEISNEVPWLVYALILEP
jgi:hypothetical protein